MAQTGQRRRVETVEEPPETEGLPAVPPMMGLKDDLPWGQSPQDVVDGGSADPDSELSRVISEIGQGDELGKVTVFKINPTTRKAEWVAKYSSSEFTAMGLPGLAKAFGAGEFSFFIYDANTRLRARKTVTIAESAAPISRDPAVDPSASLSGLEKLADAMREGFTSLASMIAQSKGQSRKEWLEEMLLYKQLFGSQNTNGDGRTFEQLKTAIEFVKDLQPREGEAGFLDAAMKFIDKFAPTINKALEQAAASAPVAAPGVAPAPAVLAGPAQTTGDPNAMMFHQAMLKSYLDLLVDSALNDHDPATYANMILDKVPLPILDQWLAKGDLVSELAKHDPRVNQPQVRAWFIDLQNEVIAARKEMDAPENEEPQAQS